MRQVNNRGTEKTGEGGKEGKCTTDKEFIKKISLNVMNGNYQNILGDYNYQLKTST